jgi:SAM-dependent methyltransferase
MADNMHGDGSYPENNPSWHVEDSPWQAKKIIKMIEKHHMDPSSVCEIGCGAGEILTQLSQRSLVSEVTFYGYEISPQAYGLCKQRESEKVKFFLEDLTVNVNACFDVVLAIDVIEHVEDYRRFLRRLRTKGRYKILHIPLDFNALCLMSVGFLASQRKSIGHIHYFAKDTALSTLQETGYEIIDWFYTRANLELPKPAWKAKLAHLPSRIVSPINEDLSVRLFGG